MNTGITKHSLNRIKIAYFGFCFCFCFSFYKNYTMDKKGTFLDEFRDTVEVVGSDAADDKVKSFVSELKILRLAYAPKRKEKKRKEEIK